MTAPSSSSRSFKLALVQMRVTASKAFNLAAARAHVLKAASSGADIVVLPECFNSPYGTEHFAENAESIDGPTAKALSTMAREARTYLIGGSFPESSQSSQSAENNKYYNTCAIFSPSGDLLAVHRKLHLFDINVPATDKSKGIVFRESDVLSPGTTPTHFTTPWGNIGVGICYDLRFPELAMIAARRESCVAMIYPGAFNMTTGPLHWELLLRSRALDNQIYVAACSPARDESRQGGYVAYGHSTVVDPMGAVVATTEGPEATVMAEVDLDRIDETRTSIPISTQRRFDVYRDVASASPS
ncbi:Carbon-nitrogen hydrolase [Thoreauomyces humboldtii]|nr:Carbon-nitrogen hydrolase [Thoreauomyces humboldtii]